MLEHIFTASIVGEAVLLTGVLCVASISDLRERRIPNYLTYGAFVASIFIALLIGLTGVDPDALPQRLAGFSVSFGVMLVAYFTIGIGAGDVKLAAVLGGLLGVRSGLEIIFLAHIVGGVFAACLIVYRIGPSWLVYKLLATCAPAKFPQPVLHKHKLSYPVPMAVFFAIATMLCLGGVQVL
ncbi:MAG: prepilin peptidase [Planctomycetaceae bacterium]